MGSSERRRHVRVKPSVELPVRAALAGDGLMREALNVVDLSVGGLALSSPTLRGAKPGQTLKVLIMLGLREEHAVDTVVRWVSDDTLGVELVEPPASATQAIGRYISELLERGSSP